MSKRKENKYSIGMIGLGTMGCNLLLNIADHGYSGAGYDKNAVKVSQLNQIGAGKNVKGFVDIDVFVKQLESPRVLMLLVPAGKIVDDVINELLPLLNKGDLIIDAGNSHFIDTERRSLSLESQGFHFFGMGVSGGEEGARNGPSMMPGGDKQAYKYVQHILEAITAKVNDKPCVTYIGPGASGHFVKMVHNGIEYALMQLIAETYDILKKGLGLDNKTIQKVFFDWNNGSLRSYLIEITAAIFSYKNPDTSNLLLDDISDIAKSKGTGKWTSQVAMDLNLPVPVIDIAVSMRDLSKYKSLRTEGATIYSSVQPAALTEKAKEYIKSLEQAYYFSMIITYAQGMHLLYKASATYNYKLELDEIARIWRGGCIIRSSFLETIYSAFKGNKNLEHLLLDDSVRSLIKNCLPDIRRLVSDSVANGIALPAYAASISYFDTFRSEKMPSNLIQAQRDFFGAHTYELIDREGIFHSDWNKNENKV
jgi:6-phosphogluconate dehydrogenase